MIFSLHLLPSWGCDWVWPYLDISRITHPETKHSTVHWAVKQYHLWCLLTTASHSPHRSYWLSVSRVGLLGIDMNMLPRLSSVSLRSRHSGILQRGCGQSWLDGVSNSWVMESSDGNAAPQHGWGQSYCFCWKQGSLHLLLLTQISPVS